MSTIYLAARFSRKDELAGYARRLEDMGHVVTSRWLRGDHDWDHARNGPIPAGVRAQFAIEDLVDIDAAEEFVCFTEPDNTDRTSGGRHVEYGYAVAKDKFIWIVGESENVFYSLGDETGNLGNIARTHDLEWMFGYFEDQQ